MEHDNTNMQEDVLATGSELDQATSSVWHHILDGVSKGLAEVVIAIDGQLGMAIGQSGFEELSERCKELNGSSLSHEIDPESGLHIITVQLPNDDDEQTPEEDTARSASTRAKPSRPPNAFILYRQKHHGDVVKNHPGLHNNQISKIIGRMWQSENASVKEFWHSKARQVKEEHLKKYPGYQYKPRKSHEKKRRSTKTSQADQKATKQLKGWMHGSLDVPAQPTISTNGDDIAGFVFGPSSLGGIDFIKKMMHEHAPSPPIADQPIGEVIVMPGEAQMQERRFMSLHDNAAKFNAQVTLMESRLEKLLSREIGGYGGVIETGLQNFVHSERFHTVLAEE